MTFASKRAWWLCLVFALPAAAFAGTYQLIAPDAEAGGGAIAGGAYTAFTTIAATGSAAPMSGGAFEATGGLERRRQTLTPPIFADGFEDD
jgi:hypothetical protein